MERITERNFEMMSGKYQKEQLEIEARLKEVTETLNESYEKHGESVTSSPLSEIIKALKNWMQQL